MKSLMFIILTLFIIPTGGIPQQMPPIAICDSLSSADLRSEVNFDELENLAQEANAFETAQFSKPGRLMVLLQIIGNPLFNAYLKLNDGMDHMHAWFNALFKKNEVKRYEARQ